MGCTRRGGGGGGRQAAATAAAQSLARMPFVSRTRSQALTAASEEGVPARWTAHRQAGTAPKRRRAPWARHRACWRRFQSWMPCRSAFRALQLEFVNHRLLSLAGRSRHSSSKMRSAQAQRRSGWLCRAAHNGRRQRHAQQGGSWRLAVVTRVQQLGCVPSKDPLQHGVSQVLARHACIDSCFEPPLEPAPAAPARACIDVHPHVLASTCSPAPLKTKNEQSLGVGISPKH